MHGISTHPAPLIHLPRIGLGATVILQARHENPALTFSTLTRFNR